MSLQDLFTRNLRLKIFSVLMAVLIWETVHLATRQSQDAHNPESAQTNRSRPLSR